MTLSGTRTCLGVDIARRSEVFTPPEIVDRTIGLMRRRGRRLEPACGDAVFLAPLPLPAADVAGIQSDAAFAPPGGFGVEFSAPRVP
jgi:hypothetical protein